MAKTVEEVADAMYNMVKDAQGQAKTDGPDQGHGSNVWRSSR